GRLPLSRRNRHGDCPRRVRAVGILRRGLHGPEVHRKRSARAPAQVLTTAAFADVMVGLLLVGTERSGGFRVPDRNPPPKQRTLHMQSPFYFGSSKRTAQSSCAVVCPFEQMTNSLMIYGARLPGQATTLPRPRSSLRKETDQDVESDDSASMS